MCPKPSSSVSTTQLCSCGLKGSPGHYVNKGVWLCANKTLFINPGTQPLGQATLLRPDDALLAAILD